MDKRIIIVGGVAGGASAAARARRLSEDAEIVMVERGEYVSFANCGLPYFIGGEIGERGKLLLRTPEGLRKQLNIDVRVKTEAVSIDPKAKTVRLRDLTTGKETDKRYDALILSPGASPIRPPIPGANLPEVYTLRTIPDTDAIAEAAANSKTKRAAIIGAGLIGLEMAESLAQRGMHVTLIEMTSCILPLLDPEMSAFLLPELKKHGIDKRLSEGAKAIEQLPEGGIRISLTSGDTVDVDFAVVAIGVKPDIALAQSAGLEIGTRGGIRVDDRMRTSVPDIYAVGDAVEVVDFVTGREMPVPLAGPANRQGRIAAGVIFGKDDALGATQGTWIVRVFSMAAAGTGANEKSLKAAGVPYEKVYLHPFSHATYFPGASQLAIKLLFSPEGGRVLGAQVVGSDGVDKRIDVLSTAIHANMTVFDLENLELAYAPPYNSAKAPVNFAGFIAANYLDGEVRIAHWHEVKDGPDLSHQILLDVRNPDEVAAGAYPNALNIPLPQLRDRLAELPHDKEIITACAVGLRGYSAARILMQHGFTTVRNLSGGYRTWSAAKRTVK